MDNSTKSLVQEQESTAMSPKQRLIASSGRCGRLAIYRDLVVGPESLLFFSGFELYNLLICGMGSALGIGLRSLLLPALLKSFGRGSVVGRGVTIRQPRRVSLGRAVFVDDGAALDVRSKVTIAETPTAAAEPGIEIGDNVLIGRNTIVTTKGGRIILHDACNISSDCRIATTSTIEIGKSVLVAAYVYIGCGNHGFRASDKPIIEQEMEGRGGVKIGANSWIGTRATILDGVTIGENAVVGAHALVREDVPDNAIVAGTPAKIMRYRG